MIILIVFHQYIYLLLNSLNYKMRCFFVFVFLFSQIIDISLSDPIVTIPNGQIKGKVEITRTNYTFYSFNGIRYAKPPVGDLRFKAPQPAEPWSGVYDATQEKNICFQVPGNSNTENEDCLFMHIYTPEINATKLRPVMFFIYGGGFVQGGSGRNYRYGPDFFMEYDVVLVTFNYRLGPFGFSATGDLVIQGNAGLKDQNLALKWVQENIKYFGGDPSKVTIFGQSAGSASVAYHLLSPKSKNLFRGAILESGSALSPWASQREQRAYTFKTAELIDPSYVKSNKSEDLLNYLMKATARQIDGASQVIYNTQTPGNTQLQQGFYYAPVIEPEHEDAFLTSSMFESFEKGEFNKVPVIMGFNGEEMIGQYNSHSQDIINAFLNNEDLLLPNNMHLTKENANTSTVVKAIENLYGITKGNSYAEQLVGTIRYLTDTCFVRSIIKQAELQSKFSDVYFYVFGYDGKMGDSSAKLAGTGNVSHNEDLNYMWSRILKSSKEDNTDFSLFPEADIKTHYRLMTLWTNFAKFLNPTPTADPLLENVIWKKMDSTASVSGQLEYLDINKDLVMKANPRWNPYVSWDNLYTKFAIKPLDGY